MTERKIPRAIKQSILNELKKIDKDVNKAIESLIHAKTRETEPETQKEDLRVTADKLWPYIKAKVEITVDQGIEDAKRGYK